MPSKHKTCTDIHLFANKIHLKHIKLLRVLLSFDYLILVWENENETTCFCRGNEKKERAETDCKSSSPEVFCKKGVLKNFAQFTGRPLCQSLFFKLQA